MFRKSLMFIKENLILYNNSTYDYLSIIQEKNLLKRRIIIILDEDLYIKTLNIDNNKKEITVKIQEIINAKFGFSEDYLFDYKFSKRKKQLDLYAIKGGDRVDKLISKRIDVKVVPIQVHVFKLIRKIIKIRNFDIIFYFSGTYYYVSISENNIKSTLLAQSKDILINKLTNCILENSLYIDKKIKYNFENLFKEIKLLEFGGILNEEAFKK